MSMDYVKDAATGMRTAAGVSGVVGTSGIVQILADLPNIKWWLSLTGIITSIILAWVQVKKVGIQDRRQHIDELEKAVGIRERELNIEQIRRKMDSPIRQPEDA